MIRRSCLLVFINIIACDLAYGRHYRLPNTTIPLHYCLKFETNVHLGESIYNGEVIITIQVLEETDQIVLHSDVGSEMDILIYDENFSESIPLANFELEPETQFLRIATGRLLEQSEILQLAIRYNSTLRGNHTGFFMNTYQKDDREEEFYAMTHFEPSYARNAFPCYDEPGLRATFDVEVVCDASYNAHSNGDMLEEFLLTDGRKLVRFERTPPMQTYLLAVLVSDFAENIRFFGELRIGILTRSVDEGMLEFAFKVSGESLQALEVYCGQNYSLPKLDQVGIDGHPGGMENWGLILYDESYLILGENSVTDWMAVESASIIMHEIAHQFFGNLVGPRWWTYLWLNEGFATFMSDKLIRQQMPEYWYLVDYIYYSETWTALDYDSSPLTHPMSYYVEQPEDIESLLWGSQAQIVYTKSSRVIKMMETVLGEQTFRAGIQNYFDTHKYESAETNDLYRSLSKETSNNFSLSEKATVADIFGSWANQSGHPIVYVERIGYSKKYRFTQKRYKGCSCDNARWWIPIFYRSYRSTSTYEDILAFWIPSYEESIVKEIDDEFVLINSQGHGFYRVNYWPDGWQQITDNWYTIDASAKAKLLDDAFSLVWQEQLDARLLFNMLVKLANDTDPLPWIAAMSEHNLDYMVHALSARGYAKSIKLFAKRLTTHMLRIFRNDSRPEAKEARNVASEWACMLQMPSCTVLSRHSRSIRASENCKQMYVPEYLSTIRCNSASLERLIRAIKSKACLGDERMVKTFAQNVLTDCKRPEMVLNVLETFIQFGVTYFVEALEDVLNELDTKLPDNQQMEKLLYRLSFYAFQPSEQELMIGLMERFIGISGDRRVIVQQWMKARVDNAMETARLIATAVESNEVRNL